MIDETKLKKAEKLRKLKGNIYKEPFKLKSDKNLQLFNYYKEEINFSFKLYLEGKITLDQFIDAKNFPNECMLKPEFKEFEKKIEKKRKTKYNKFAKNIGFGNDGKKAFNMITNIQNKQIRITSKNFNENVKLKEKIKKIKDEPEKPLVIEKIDTKIYQRIYKLRQFLLAKMKEKRRSQKYDNDLYQFKIFEIIMNIAGEIIGKIERTNLVDFIDLNPDIDQKTLKRYSNFSVKTNRIKSRKLDNLDSITQNIRINKIETQMKNNSSSYVESIKSLFRETADYYFYHLRPTTPKLKNESESKKNIKKKSNFKKLKFKNRFCKRNNTDTNIKSNQKEIKTERSVNIEVNVERTVTFILIRNQNPIWTNTETQ